MDAAQIKNKQVDGMKEKYFVTIGLVLACIISISIPVETAVKYVQERENNSLPKEETPYPKKSSSEPGGN
jgi:hypothetical protein